MFTLKTLQTRWTKRLLAASSGQLCPRDALRSGLVSFSQAGEDIIIFNLLIELKRRPPFHYIDVGCFEPVRYSNTYFFYLLGGSGVVIDLHEAHEPKFKELRPRDRFVSAAVSDKVECIEVVSEGTPFDKIGTSSGGSHETRMPRSLASILAENWPRDRRMDILDVDCEGGDLAVLRSNDWKIFRPAIIVAEDPKSSDQAEAASGLESFLHNVGYSTRLKLRNNTFFVDATQSA